MEVVIEKRSRFRSGASASGCYRRVGGDFVGKDGGYGAEGSHDDGPPKGETSPASFFGSGLAEEEENRDVAGEFAGDVSLLFCVRGALIAAVFAGAFELPVFDAGDEPGFASLLEIRGLS